MINILIDKRANLGDMQLGDGAVEKGIRVRDIEHGDGDKHVQRRPFEQVVEEGGLVHGQLLQWRVGEMQLDLGENVLPGLKAHSGGGG